MGESNDLKSTLVKHLAELPNLYTEQRNCAGRWTEEWLTGEELAEYQCLSEIERDIARQVDEAGQTVPRETRIYPKEYQDLLAQLAERKPYTQQVSAIMSALRNFNVIDFPQVRTLANIFYSPCVEEIEYRELTEAQGRRERVNSKVAKIRRAAYEVYEAKVKKMEAQTRARLEWHAAGSLKRKEELERLAHSRKQAKLQPINTQIRELLDTAIQLAKAE